MVVAQIRLAARTPALAATATAETIPATPRPGQYGPQVPRQAYLRKIV
jgi:hypothetical protein